MPLWRGALLKKKAQGQLYLLMHYFTVKFYTVVHSAHLFWKEDEEADGLRNRKPENLLDAGGDKICS
jgi:uncharacterized membrane protein